MSGGGIDAVCLGMLEAGGLAHFGRGLKGKRPLRKERRLEGELMLWWAVGGCVQGIVKNVVASDCSCQKRRDSCGSRARQENNYHTLRLLASEEVALRVCFEIREDPRLGANELSTEEHYK